MTQRREDRGCLFWEGCSEKGGERFLACLSSRCPSPGMAAHSVVTSSGAAALEAVALRCLTLANEIASQREELLWDDRVFALDPRWERQEPALRAEARLWRLLAAKRSVREQSALSGSTSSVA